MVHHLYCLEFPNGKIYFGIAINVPLRLSRHRTAASRGSRLPVHCAIRKYGFANVTARVCCIGSKEYIASLEIAAIAALSARDRSRGYNVCVGGEAGPMVDRSHTEVSRAKMSTGQKARVRTDCDPSRMSAMAKSRQSTPEWRKSLSEAAAARWARDGKAPVSEKQAAALAAGRIKRQGPCKPETRAKIAAALVGRKIGAGYQRTDETTAKQRASMIGRKPNPAQQAALEAGRLARWQK